jgi:hypothetical protein
MQPLHAATSQQRLFGGQGHKTTGKDLETH